MFGGPGGCSCDVVRSECGEAYALLDHLAEGSCGKVVRCQRSGDGTMFAVKLMPRKSREAHDEASVLRGLPHHPHVVKMQDIFHCGCKASLCIVLELLDSTIAAELSRSRYLPLVLIRKYGLQLLQALAHLRKYKTIHFDIKPSNLMLRGAKRRELVLVDFSSAVVGDHQQRVVPCRTTPHYRSPEMLFGAGLSAACDIWASGCVLGQMWWGAPLFPGFSPEDQIRRIVHAVGMPSDALLQRSCRAHRYFEQKEFLDDGRWRRSWRLKAGAETSLLSEAQRLYKTATLKEVAYSRDAENVLRATFLDLLHGLLSLDPEDRLTAESAVIHPFVMDLPGGRCDGTRAPASASTSSRGLDVERMAALVGQPGRVPRFAIASSQGLKAKNRVLNFWDVPLEIALLPPEFALSSVELLLIEPRGSSWMSIPDDRFATVMLRLPGGRWSEKLPLDMPGTVRVPDCAAIAELVTVGEGCYRVLFASAPLKLHNRSRVPLVVRFYSLCDEVVQLESPETSTCDGDVIGHSVRVKASCSCYPVGALQAITSSDVVLGPNSFFSVPDAALIWSGSTVVKISVKPYGYGYDFSTVTEVDFIGDVALSCRGLESARGSNQDRHLHAMHFLCETMSVESIHPEQVHSATIVLGPTLQMLNALPNMSIRTQYGANGGDDEGWHAADVPQLTVFHVHDLPPEAFKKGVNISASLGDSSCWSRSVLINSEALVSGTSWSQVMGIKQRSDGASAGIVWETIDRYSIRISCPQWFVERVGLKDAYIAVHRNGQPFPSSQGITLLPCDCHTHDCSAVVTADGCDRSGIHHLRMPLAFSTFSMQSPVGSLVLCLARQGIHPGTILGARCQVLTLRPRLTLTNSSEQDLSLRFGVDNTILRLENGQSKEHHWDIGLEENPLNTSLRFRPENGTAIRWSETALCADAAAGSTAFSLLPENQALSAEHTQVWSVEVSALYGALSVTFKRGSRFVVANRTANATMVVRPSGKPGFEMEVHVGPGQEAEYGWADPFGGNGRAVDVMVDGQLHILSDVRRPSRKFLDWQKTAVVMHATCAGGKAIIALEDPLEADEAYIEYIAAQEQQHAASCVEQRAQYIQQQVAVQQEHPHMQVGGSLEETDSSIRLPLLCQIAAFLQDIVCCCVSRPGKHCASLRTDVMELLRSAVYLRNRETLCSAELGGGGQRIHTLPSSRPDSKQAPTVNVAAPQFEPIHELVKKANGDASRDQLSHHSRIENAAPL